MKHRMRGFGGVFHPTYRDRKTGERRESPTWWIRYYFRGTKKVESSNSTKESDAVRLLRNRIAEMGRGRLIGPSAERVTFEDLKQLVILDYKAEGNSSLDRVERAFKNLEAFFGLYRAVDITKDKLLQYITTRQQQRHLRRGEMQSIQPATYKYELAMLKRAFNLAIEA
jgi:hypothetical protein